MRRDQRRGDLYFHFERIQPVRRCSAERRQAFSGGVMKFKFKRTNTIRIAVQVIILLLLGYVAVRPLFNPAEIADFESYCPFGGLSSLLSKINQGTMSCQMSEVQVMLGIGLLLGILFIGKLFCSFICPIGSISEWLGKIGEKLKIRRDVPKVADRPLRILKYLLLFATLYFTMTTSELFCKKFDPYYATVNLFQNADIFLYYAIPAFVVTILGAVLLRLSWCRYLCPLGALSNIFMNVAFSGGLIVLYVAASLAGIQIGFVWLIAGLVAIGLLNETGWMKSFILPFFKITRNTTSCTNCGICDVKCPQGIEITKYEKVNHIDCTLCGDCVYACPVKDTLTINKSRFSKYIAPVGVILLIALSLIAARNFEFTTISERWGGPKENLAVYQQSGLKNVKCYGSSKSLQAQLQKYTGIYGLDTWARSHTVKIYYDPAEITENEIRNSLFSPVKQELRGIKEGTIQTLSMWEIGIAGLFDLIDSNYFLYLLREDEGIHGLETQFGEPVKATIFYNPDKTDIPKMLKLFERDFVMVKAGNGEKKVGINFKPEGKGVDKGPISVLDYKKRIFRPYDQRFNKYNSYDKEKLRVFSFPMPEATTPASRRFLPSLTSHLSADDGIVRLATRYAEVPYADVYFDPAQVTVEKIKAELVKPKLTVFLSGGNTKEMDNPFHLKPENGVVKTIAELE
jgi:NAD-dependent dihydropyrimidine dehydrogenase PreA subunit